MPNTPFLTNFDVEYQKLNDQQKQAVDLIEGPVMVIAGAGTGKTQTIALRIANILKLTQTNPSSILCLTFTDNAALNMRQRLLSIIGPTAYSVKIHTFHSFCYDIIRSHPDDFVFSSDSQALDDLEKIEIVENLIELLPDGAILKPWGDHFHYQRDIISHLQTLKREYITPAKLETLIKDQLYFLENSVSQYQQLKQLRVGKTLETDLMAIFDSLEHIPNLSATFQGLFTFQKSLYISGGYVVGPAKNPTINLKNTLLKIIENLQKDVVKQQELLAIYSGYQKELKLRGRYDFEDMILFVLNAFKEKPELLLESQEICQYLLVDEYQDTNSAQNQIISLLSAYHEHPNLFVVGDDDQSIFRFQGAAIENIFEFHQKYHPELIVLRNNYRSHQLILDSSTSVINRNQNRIANYIKDIDKTLISVKTADPDPINLVAANSGLEENHYIATKIQELIISGVKPSEIAVLYRNNSDIIDLAEVLDNTGIKFYLPQEQNILEDPLIFQLINLLRYIDNPSLDSLVFHLLASPFIDLHSLDLLKLLRYSRHHKIKISDLIANPDELTQISPPLSKTTHAKLHNFTLHIGQARKWQVNLSLDKFFNQVIRKFKYLDFCLQTNDPRLLNKLFTFYSELKKQSLEKKLTLPQFLNRLQLLMANRLPLPAPMLNIDQDQSIKLLTVHRAKGLEYEHVFLYKVVDKKWGNNPDRSSLHLPFGILHTELTAEINDPNEEERRLFYVALTRAKSQIYISYSTISDSQKTQTPSQFISEIDQKHIQPITIPPTKQIEALTSFFNPITTITSDNDRQLFDYLQKHLSTDYQFNVTHLNSYLCCPLCFYYQTILKIPSPKDKFSSYGTAIHHTLSYLFNQLQRQKAVTSGQLIRIFENYLLKENLPESDYQESLARGRQTLTDYYDFYQSSFNSQNITDYDFSSENITLPVPGLNIPLTGKIDLIEILDNQFVNVIDFKTGNPDGKYKELSETGDYFRQLVFYNLLVSLSPFFKYQVKQSIIDFVQKSKQKNSLVKKEFVITPDNLEKLKAEIIEVYGKIQNMDFFKIGPECQDRHHLHYLLKNK